MHFLDAWRELSPFDLGRLLAPIAFMVAATLLPGRRAARYLLVGVGLTLVLLREIAVTPLVQFLWIALWLAIAWQVRDSEELARRPSSPAGAMLESGTVGLLLGCVLLALMVAAVARQDMSPEDSRRVSYGVLWIGVGLLHLMLRRHLRRAAAAFAALGLGLQVLDGAARGAQVQGTLPPGGAVVVAAAIGVQLALRIAAGRERHTGTAWVSDAHDLHD